MTFNTKAARADLVNKIAKAKAEREQQKLFRKKKGNLCQHKWKRYKQRAEIDWDAEVMKGQMRDYCGPIAPFLVVLGCEKCKAKEYVDMYSE